MKSKELALVSIFSSLWIVSQITLGPIIGTLSIGPVSFHGAINRLVGWMLMVILAEIIGSFGRVSIMSLVASLGTRMIRASPISGLVTGMGYSLGGITFDLAYFIRYRDSRSIEKSKTSLMSIALISGLIANFPYMVFKYLTLSFEAFILYVPVLVISALKGVILSIIGSMIGAELLKRANVLFTISSLKPPIKVQLQNNQKGESK